jgi:hypothetical protein
MRIRFDAPDRTVRAARSEDFERAARPPQAVG